MEYLKAPSLSRPTQEAVGDKKAEKVFVPSLSGLSGEQIRELKQLADSGAFQSFGNVLLVQEPFSFAPIISLGVIVTLICQGTFYSNPLLGKLL